MERKLKEQIDLLLAEAGQAADERANGLMDRSDFRHLIEKLGEVTRILADTCEQLEQEHEDLARPGTIAPRSPRMACSGLTGALGSSHLGPPTAPKSTASERFASATVSLRNAVP